MVAVRSLAGVSGFLISIFVPLFFVAALLFGAAELYAHIIRERAFDSMETFTREIRLVSELVSRGGLSNRGRVPPSSGAASDSRLGASVAEGPALLPLQSLEAQGDETKALARRAMELPFSGAEVRASYGGMVRALAEAQRMSPSQSVNTQGAVSEWIPLYCEALAAFGEAIRAEPQDARLLMQWANLRQILGSTSCSAAYTAGDYKEALLKALDIDPTNTDAQYAAGLIFRWGGDIDTASKLFHSVLRYHPSLSANQERQIYASIDSPDRLTQIVPARFPQALKASRYFLSDPGAVRTVAVREPGFLSALEVLQLEALKESHEQYTSGLLPFSMHLQRLNELTDFAATTQIRQELDRRLAVLLVRAGDPGLAHYLEERQRLYELEVMRSSIAGDTRPLKSSLVEWGGAGSYFADEFYQSVGFFLAPQQGVQAIEMRFSARPSQAFRSALRVYVSSDNKNWSEIEQRGPPHTFSLGSKHFVVLRVPTKGESYWKVHFANASRERKLLTSLSEGVRVFGLSARQVPHEQTSN